MRENLQNIQIQALASFSTEKVAVDILRLDLIHPVVSGNKWFKLQYYLAEALELGKTSVATFGGAYSNHILATAFAASESGFQSLGLIRGEPPEMLSPTLQEAAGYGMQLVFIDRNAYRDKETLRKKWDLPGRYWIMEGGYGFTGARGAGDILTIFDTTAYSHILCAVGTGTMLAGLVNAAQPGQQVLGISVLKNQATLAEEVRYLLRNIQMKKKVILNHAYHFGGYAKQTNALFDFMKELWNTEGLPTDIVYTSKLLYAARDLVSKDYFPAGSRVLIIHSGGLQGNRSLPIGKLPF